jgi:uncharacterized membrane protein YjgN (DUF898 family)
LIGSILLAFIAIVLTLGMIWRSDKKHAAVGRRYGISLFSTGISADMAVCVREMQLFLLGFIIVEICEIFTVGGFPLSDAVRKVGFLQDRLKASADKTI